MEWVLFGVLSILAAILFNFVNPKILASPSTTGLQASYAGKTLLTGAAFFVVLLVAAFIMSMVDGGAEIPTA